jgi:glycine cleavage system aminomethyltransferase T
MQNGDVPTEGAVVMPLNGGPMGQVTSARYSEQLGRVIGMAWVPAPLARDGARIVVSDEDKRLEGHVQTKPFYDPEGEILRS